MAPVSTCAFGMFVGLYRLGSVRTTSPGVPFWISFWATSTGDASGVAGPR